MPDGRIAVGCLNRPAFWLWDWKRTTPVKASSYTPYEVHFVACLRNGQLLGQCSNMPMTKGVRPGQDPYGFYGLSHFSTTDGGWQYALGQPDPDERDMSKSIGLHPLSRGEAFSVADDGETIVTINSKVEIRVYRKGLPDAVIHSSPTSVADFKKWRDANDKRSPHHGPLVSIPPLMAIVGDRIVVRHGDYIAVFGGA